MYVTWLNIKAYCVWYKTRYEEEKEMQGKIDIIDMQDDKLSLVITKLVIQLCISELNNSKEWINTNPHINPSRDEDRSSKNQKAYSDFFSHFSSDEHDIHLEEMLGICEEWMDHHQKSPRIIGPEPGHSSEDLRHIREENSKSLDRCVAFLNSALSDEILLTDLRDTLQNGLSFALNTGHRA